MLPQRYNALSLQLPKTPGECFSPDEVTCDVDRRVLERCDLHLEAVKSDANLTLRSMAHWSAAQRSTKQHSMQKTAQRRSSTACKRQHSAAQRAQDSTAQGGIARHQSTPARLSRQAHRKVGDHGPDEGDKQGVWDAL